MRSVLKHVGALVPSNNKISTGPISAAPLIHSPGYTSFSSIYSGAPASRRTDKRSAIIIEKGTTRMHKNRNPCNSFCNFAVRFSVYSCASFLIHKTRQQKKSVQEIKVIVWSTFKLGLALTGFRLIQPCFQQVKLTRARNPNESQHLVRGQLQNNSRP